MRVSFSVMRSLAAAAAIGPITGSLGAAAPAGTPARTSAPVRRNVAPQAAQLLQRTCDLLTDAKPFTFHAEVMFDQVLPSAMKLQFAGAHDYAVQRPDEFTKATWVANNSGMTGKP